MYYRVVARDYANQYTSNAATICPCNGSACTVCSCQDCIKGTQTVKRNSSVYNSGSYPNYCCNDCANYVSQAMAAGSVPTSNTWKSGTSAWVGCGAMKTYFTSTNNWWTASNYTNCNAGGIIMLTKAGSSSPYHVVMCVHNDTATRKFSGHTTDRKEQLYDLNYNWGTNTSASYYVFSYCNPV